MKKALIIIISLLVIAGIAIGSVMIFKDKKEKNNSETDAEASVTQVEVSSEPFSDIIFCETPEALKAKTEENKATIDSDEGSLYISGVNGWGYDFYITGVGDIDGKYARVEAYCNFFEKEKNIDAERLYQITKTIIPGFAQMFGVSNLDGSGYYICDNDGNPMDTESIDTYAEVLNGKAAINTSVKESEDSYWELTINSAGSNGPMCFINHYINDSDFSAVSGIINTNN